MIKEAINRILELAPASAGFIELGGRSYTKDGLSLIKEPRVEPLQLETLGGVVDFLRENRDDLAPGELFLVASWDGVLLYGLIGDEDNERQRYLHAKLVGRPFDFDRYMEVEAFIIGLNSRFVKTDYRDALLEMASGIRVDAGADITDNGISQEVTVKAGARVKVEKTPNPITLCPFRTFREVEQPESEFIFRLTKGEDGPRMGLFEADGGAWKLEATVKVAGWLDEALRKESIDVPVIA